MENLHYHYIVHLNKQRNLHEDWDFMETCNICHRNFRSKKALWGHKRCCKAARNEVTTSTSGFRHDALDSGWTVTAKRGRKPVIDITCPESIAAGILLHMSSAKNDSQDLNAEMNNEDGSPPLDDGDNNRFTCVVCGKVLLSYQALGGHKASHGKDDTTVVNLGKDEKGPEHRCEVCGVSYPSGQALGGHKRKHWTGPFGPGNNCRSRGSEIEGSGPFGPGNNYRINRSEIEESGPFGPGTNYRGNGSEVEGSGPFGPGNNNRSKGSGVACMHWAGEFAGW